MQPYITDLHLWTVTEQRKRVSADRATVVHSYYDSSSFTVVNRPNLFPTSAKLLPKQSSWSANWLGKLWKRYQPAIRSPDTERSSLFFQSSTRVVWQINVFCLECPPLHTGQIRCFHTFRSQCINTPVRPAPQYWLMISITTSFSLQLLMAGTWWWSG